MIAGQARLGLEILENLPEVEAVLVPVDGGGLIAGVAVAIKEQRPAVRIIGVKPLAASSATVALKAGTPRRSPPSPPCRCRAGASGGGSGLAPDPTLRGSSGYRKGRIT
ncbi:hypothetical protein DFAR_2240003 [Desulfarculales bacterium]